jgi:CRP-like cAMP-binding protein
VNAERLADIRAACPFRLVHDDDVDQLGRETTISEVANGTTLFEQGDRADSVAAILAGNVEVVRDGRVLASLDPGSVIGELSLFVPSATRSATVRTTSPVRMITWGAVDVLRRLDEHERLATAIAADLAFVLAERLERRTQDVISLLQAAGTRLPVSELERFRRSAVE